ncbi:MAG: paraquat-inducible protein A [Pseudohongiellaceae bacterium]|jgi:paraquat-inducible protein A
MDDGQTSQLIACHDCDALFPMASMPGGFEARCHCCDGVVARRKVTGAQHSVAWAGTGAIFWIIANVMPFMSFKLTGNTEVCLLSGGVVRLAEAGRWGLAGLVLICAIVVPAFKLLALLWMQVPLLFDRRAWFLNAWWRGSTHSAVWGMLDVFLLGCFVALTKFGDYGEISLGAGFFAFIALVISSAAAHACFDPGQLWQEKAAS